MIRSLSSGIDGPESLAEAEEYLQPSIPDSSRPSVSAGSMSIEQQNSFMNPGSSNTWRNNTTASVTDSVLQDNMSMRSPYTQVKCCSPNDSRQYYNCGHMNSDNSSSKYTTIQIQPVDSDAVDADEIELSTRMKEAQLGNLKLDLPVDEDDYLMPFPQPGLNNTSYIDLIGDSNSGDGSVKSPTFQKYPDFLPKGKKGLDNPEYLLTSTENINALDVEPSIPKITEEDDPVAPSSISEDPAPIGLPPVPFVAQKSVEEESISDHEYYNDLQRELQPLRRNETAV